MKKMRLGEVIDFIIEYNNRQTRSEKKQAREEKNGKKRKATQADFDAFFG